jgi:hypothetical protein
MARPFLTVIFGFFIFLNLVQSSKADISVGFGPEYYSWTEYFSDGVPILEESGFRYVFNVHTEGKRVQEILLGYDGKIYLGDVSYNGVELFDPVVHAVTDTFYFGFQNELMVSLRSNIEPTLNMDWIGGIGWDYWRRNIGPNSANQLEEYHILYFRLGPQFSTSENRGPWFGFGGKIPFYTFENAHIDEIPVDPNPNIKYDQNPKLHPGRQLSFYLNAGVRYDSGFETKITFDSYRFSKSQEEDVTINHAPAGHVNQPEVYSERWGIQLVYHFP